KFQSAPRVRTRGDALTSSSTVGQVGFQSAPRVRTRGDLALVQHALFHLRFNPRPAFARGATSASFTNVFQNAAFQSAPRVRTRGDCGPANRHRRKPLITRFRERGEFSCVGNNSIGKELWKAPGLIGISIEREIPAPESALGVRATLRLIANF